MVKKGYYGNESLGFSNLSLLYNSWTLLCDLNHFYVISVHSYMILNTSIRSQDKQEIHSRNTLFQPSFFTQKGYYGNEVFALSNCANSYTILNTLIRLWTLLYDSEHSYTILNTLIRFWTPLHNLKYFQTLSNALKPKSHINFIIL